MKDLRELLLGYYDQNGRLNRKSIQDAVQSCLSFLTVEDPSSVEQFARLHLDPVVDRLKLEPSPKVARTKWVSEAFKRTCQLLYNEVHRAGRPTKENDDIFRRYLEGLVGKWIRDWGYAKADLPFPTEQEPAPGDLVKHCLKFHIREILYQLLVLNPEEDSLANILQDAKDQEMMREILEKLDQAFKQADGLCRQYGVSTT